MELINSEETEAHTAWSSEHPWSSELGGTQQPGAQNSGLPAIIQVLAQKVTTAHTKISQELGKDYSSKLV